MTKVIGPLHSDSASGKFADSLIFRQGKNGSVVTGYYKPGSFRPFEISQAQKDQREKYSLGLDLWRAFPVEERAYWSIMAKFLEVNI